MPDHLYPPEIYDGFQPYFDAFFDLSTDRQIGMGEGPIPHSKIMEYFAFSGWDKAEWTIFKTVIRKMDGAYLAYRNRKDDEAQHGAVFSRDMLGRRKKK